MSSSADHPVAEPKPVTPIEDDEHVLRKHVAFFDRNGDGLVYPWETFQGFRAIGCGILISIAGALVINPAFSKKTRPGGKFNILFPIGVHDIKFAIHGSDTGVFDSEGRFVPKKFEEIFAKHAKTNSVALTKDELSEMLSANREPKDLPGRYTYTHRHSFLVANKKWHIKFVSCEAVFDDVNVWTCRFAAFTEWKLLFHLCKDKNGLLQKETIKSFYDGNLFYKMEEERKSNKKKP
ncbi:hypothetical protein QQ045_020196 [Rhodiola kirilowii]